MDFESLRIIPLYIASNKVFLEQNIIHDSSVVSIPLGRNYLNIIFFQVILCKLLFNFFFNNRNTNVNMLHVVDMSHDHLAGFTSSSTQAQVTVTALIFILIYHCNKY